MQNPKSTWRVVLETLSNVAVVVAAVVFIGMTIWQPSPGPPIGYEPGDDLPDIPAFDYGASIANFVLYLDSECPFCTQSMPFYRRLTDSVRNDRYGSVAVVVIGSEPEDSLRDYVDAYDVQPSSVARIDAREWSGLNATPTLLLVDSNGTVVEAHVGVLSLTEEDRLLADVGLCSGAPGAAGCSQG